MKKSVLFFLVILGSISSYASQYLLVQCYMEPNPYKPNAAYSDINTGKMIKAEDCGDALNKIPADYKLVNTSSRSSNSQPIINYLFEKIKPVVVI